MSWRHRIGAISQVLTGQVKPPHSVPDTCSKLATCVLFLLSAAGSCAGSSAKASAANGKSNNPNTFVNLSVFFAMLSVVTQFLGLGLANSSVINGGVGHHFQELCSSL
jgi:hypothetical protein